jgi:hypothetical protein
MEMDEHRIARVRVSRGTLGEEAVAPEVDTAAVTAAGTPDEPGHDTSVTDAPDEVTETAGSGGSASITRADGGRQSASAAAPQSAAAAGQAGERKLVH